MYGRLCGVGGKKEWMTTPTSKPEPYSHSFDEQIGGQLKAGFVITAAYEDFNNEPDTIRDSIPSYWATKAVKL